LNDFYLTGVPKTLHSFYLEAEVEKMIGIPTAFDDVG
jgi:hypothetical protein